MQIFTRNNQAPARNGFTLVELMVVLFLIGLVASAVVLSVRSASGNTGSQAEQFAGRIAALRDRSVVESRSFAFWVRPSGYGFERREGGQWKAMTAKPYQTTDWQPPMRVNIAGTQMVRIAFDASGLPSAPIEIALSGEATTIKVRLDAAGNVNVAR